MDGYFPWQVSVSSEYVLTVQRAADDNRILVAVCSRCGRIVAASPKPGPLAIAQEAHACKGFTATAYTDQTDHHR